MIKKHPSSEIFTKFPSQKYFSMWIAWKMSPYTNWTLEMIILLNLGHKFTERAFLWQFKSIRFIFQC